MSKQLHIRTRGAAARQSGFSLVEVMVGLAIGMMIMVALVALIFNVNRNNLELARTNSVIENGRFALQVLEADISHAGYWGGWVPKFDDLSTEDDPTDSPAATAGAGVTDPCTVPGDWKETVGISITAHKVVGGKIYNEVAPATPTTQVCATVIDTAAALKDDTDVLIVRHAAPCAASASATDDDCKIEVGSYYFQADRCDTGANKDVVTTATFAASADTSLLTFPGLNRGCNATIVASPATVAFGIGKDDRPNAYKFIANMYYVRTFAVTAGDGIPTLVRRTLTSAGWSSAQALVEGVDDMRVEFGIDTVSKSGAVLTVADFGVAPVFADATRKVTPTNRGDGNPDSYVHCGSGCSAFTLMNAVSARVYVLSRARSITPGHLDNRTYNLGSNAVTIAGVDRYKRQVYARTVRLNNISMRREVPSGS
jgi:type IV pilus assembly protein PilW